jgi:hypothetical protein
MRWVFLVGSVLVFSAGFQLFVLTSATDRWFAWTIHPNLTAAFLGAFYWTALILAAISGLRETWAEARAGVPGVFAFITLTLVATLLHLGKFHLHDPRSTAKGAAYLWLAIYVLDPPAVLFLWIRQTRVPGGDPDRVARLPRWFRWSVGAQGVLVLGIGATMFAVPSTASHLWAWTLTPLTSRAVSAWLVGLGLVILASVREDDWARIRPATAAYAGLGIMQVIALARYGSDIDWRSSRAWVYAVVVAAALVTGSVGWLTARRALAAAPAPVAGAP